ncbi:hypothetical protein TSACC_21000 [Terrimicrobium sacchariphilum]|uniref:Alpha-L-rhamnosidase six-hairpin glycosidase domain-containing protein n=1 Tax=Terrimicrobium sacchariphilum TaxID=690879 RepID=A0A146G4U2_TERSA|nr:hypothetical protein [Terrimicrobium sacchariphilum]GAT32601.1 hypothetical protein TSACC_21000 [Terrimicrobium sacchariphilum]
MLPLRSAHPSRLLMLALAFCGILGSPVLRQAAAAPTESQAEHEPPLRWIAWGENEIETLSTSDEDQKRSTRGLLDGKANTVSQFKKLEGSVITIRFKQPQKIGRMAFVQGGPGNSALPRELSIILDGDGAAPIHVELLKAPGKIQTAPIDRTVRQIHIRVESVWKEPGKTRPEGGFADIGAVEIAPAEWSFVQAPLQAHQTSLRLTLTSPRDTTANVTALINRGARGASSDIADDVTYRHPEIAVQAGTHDYTVELSSLTEAQPYDILPLPQNLDRLLIASTDPEVGLKLEALTPIQPPHKEAIWSPLPAINFPTREIKGESWREGLSHHTSGRFSNTAYNGLLTEIVGASWFRAYAANGEQLRRRQDFDFYVDGQQTDDTGRDEELWKVRLRQSYNDSEKIAVNWTTMRVDLKVENDTIRYTYGILVPGFLVDSPRPLNFSSRGGGQLPFRSGAPDEDEVRFQRLAASSGGSARIGPAAILTSQGLITKPQTLRDLREPWFVGIWGLDGRPTFWGDKAVAVLFTSDAKEPVEWTPAGLRLPPGKWGVSTAFYGLLNDHWDEGLLADRARLLTRFLRTYPVDCREYYKVEANTVRILNEFSYDRWGQPGWQAADYAPIPPIYSWARDSLGWTGIPVGVSPKGTGKGVATPIGPWRWEEGNTLAYELPRVAAPHAAFPRRSEFESTIKSIEAEIHEAVKKPPLSVESNHPWIMAYYKRWTHALIGGGFLANESRSELLDVARPLVRRMYEPSSWIPRKERFTGEPYYIRGWRDRHMLPAMFGDPNSNVGQAAYSTYLYAKYSGDWALVEELWPRIMDTLRIFEVLNDWAVPQTTSREAVKFSSIDMDTIAYAGLAAMERMAEVLGKTEDLERIAYLRTKIAAATALRLNFVHYLDPKGEFPALFGVGFAEDGPALEMASKDSGSGLDHVAMIFSWTGEMPELSGFYFNILGADFMRKFQADFMDNQFSGWRTMPINNTRSATHIAIRAFLPEWPADKIQNDIDIWLKYIKQKTPPYGTAGMVGAWSGHETGIWLINWEPARFVSSAYEKELGRLQVELVAERPFTLDFSAPGRIETVRIDGGEPLPMADITTLPPINAANPSALHHQVRLPHGGRIEIQMRAENPPGNP